MSHLHTYNMSNHFTYIMLWLQIETNNEERVIKSSSQTNAMFTFSQSNNTSKDIAVVQLL